MKERWLKEKCVILSALCLSLLLGTNTLYGQEAKRTKAQQLANQVEVQQEVSSSEGRREDKNSKNQDADNPLQVCLSLAALFGIGSLTAVLVSTLYKLYLSRKVMSLPVLYYGKKEEEVYE